MTVVDPFTGHELWAEVYDAVPNPLLFLEERELSQWLGSLEGLSVADIGCGTGRWIKRALSLGARSAVGIDFSPKMLAQAAQKPELRGRLALAKAAQIPLKSSSIECVICGFVLGYFSQLQVIANEFDRILKPNGSLFCSDFHASAHQRGWKRVFKRNAQNVEIESTPYQTAQIVNAFGDHFHLERQADLQLGEPERPLFERAGKSGFFEQAKSLPAVILIQWRKTGNVGGALRAAT
jgi:malonyl-CoA O-methyltransferase